MMQKAKVCLLAHDKRQKSNGSEPQSLDAMSDVC